MSYTILTVPFELKEKAEGEFLKKGFVVDDFLKKDFENNNDADFFKIIEFSDELIKCSVARNLLKKCGDKKEDFLINYNTDNQPEFKLTKTPTFISRTKYLPSVAGYYKLLKSDAVIKKGNNRNSTDLNTEEAQNKIDKEEKSTLKRLSETLINDLEFFVRDEEGHQHHFKIEAIKLVINRPSINEGLGFGYFILQLEWVDDQPNSPHEFVARLSSIANFYRWLNNENDNKTMFYHPSCNKEIWNKKLEKKASEISIDIEKFKIKDEENNKFGLFFHELIFDVVQEYFKIDDYRKIVVINNQEFSNENEKKKEIIKPYILHLYQTNQKLNQSEPGVSDFLSNVYKTLRIPDSQNVSLKEDLNLEFKPFNPDSFTEFYSISEGALIIKGNSELNRKKEMINDFYPAFLFALNQRQLFQYCQNRINSIKLDKNNRYHQKDIRRLRGLLVNAEFTQVFTSISNYHEIDYFYEILRKNFKINILREEYMNSIDGLQSITSLAIEKEANKSQKRLNAILLILTVAQVWAGVSSLLDKKIDWAWYLNFSIYLVLLSIIPIIYLLKKVKK